jgi:HK97 gp10 family phage protein
MANNTTFVSNKKAVMTAFEKAIGQTLHTIGLTFVRLAGDEADKLIYDTPLPTPSPGWEWTKPWIERTGDYRRNLMYKVDIGDKTVYLGVSQGIAYSVFLELGTWKMRARPVISNTVQGHKETWAEIIRDNFGEHFKE